MELDSSKPAQRIEFKLLATSKTSTMQKELNEDKLAALLSVTHRTNPQKPVMIRADGRAQWKHGVRVMGLVTTAAPTRPCEPRSRRRQSVRPIVFPCILSRFSASS